MDLVGRSATTTTDVRPSKAGLFAGTITTAKLKDSEAISGSQLSNDYTGDYTTHVGIIINHYKDPY